MGGWCILRMVLFLWVCNNVDKRIFKCPLFVVGDVYLVIPPAGGNSCKASAHWSDDVLLLELKRESFFCFRQVTDTYGHQSASWARSETTRQTEVQTPQGRRQKYPLAEGQHQKNHHQRKPALHFCPMMWSESRFFIDSCIMSSLSRSGGCSTHTLMKDGTKLKNTVLKAREYLWLAGTLPRNTFDQYVY